MWYKNIRKLPNFNFEKVHLTGRYEANKEKAKKMGIRYKRWGEVARHWLANPGINRPYPKYWTEAIKYFRKIKDLHAKKEFEEIAQLQAQGVESVRNKIKKIFELKPNEYSIIFDSNGSMLCSTMAKIFKKKEKLSLTFSDQGRLVYAALVFESKTIRKFVANFEQQIGLFEAPPPKQKINIKRPIPDNLIRIEIFKPDLTYCSDAEIIDQYHRAIQDNRIDFVLLLHVSRTGRILPVEDLIKITRDLRPDLLVFVDGAQAIGRMSYEKIKNIIRMADGYMIVGHKALGAMVSAAFIVKSELNSLIKKRLENTEFYYQKLFKFEGEEENLKILKKANDEGKPYFFISLPEIISLKNALEDNYQNFWEFQKIIAEQKEDITKFLNQEKNIYFNVNRFNAVDDIISFHLKNPQKAILLKDYLQNLNPPITIGPLTENYAIRIGIEPKLPNIKKTIAYLKETLRNFLKSD
ncbi:MAG: aminotransferase class V-fold PLP-dependent enzyme [Candidatus Anstonellaceae archaeon]